MHRPHLQVLDYEAVLWEPDGKIHELRPLHGDTVGFALGINDKGQVVGSSGVCANTPLFPLPIGPHAVLWEPDGSPVNVGSLGDKTIHTFLWTKERRVRDLGTVGADLASLPGGMGSINNKGQVVGESCDSIL